MYDPKRVRHSFGLGSGMTLRQVDRTLLGQGDLSNSLREMLTHGGFGVTAWRGVAIRQFLSLCKFVESESFRLEAGG